MKTPDATSTNLKHPSLKSVAEITNALLRRAIIGFLLTGCFVFGMVGVITHPTPRDTTVLVPLSCAVVLSLMLTGLWTVLALGFRNLKRWAYDGVVFLTNWGSLVLARRIKEQLRQEDVRKAFGLETKPEIQAEEEITE